MRSITKTNECANIGDNSSTAVNSCSENDLNFLRDDSDVDGEDLSTELADYPSSAAFGKLGQKPTEKEGGETNIKPLAVATVPSARWSMRLERLEKEAREIQRLDEMRRQMMRAEQWQMRQVFQRLLENQRLLEADVIAAANISASNKMAAATGRRRKQQLHHHQRQFVDGSIGAEVILTQTRRNRSKETGGSLTSSIDVRGERLHGDHQQGFGVALTSDREYYIHGGGVLGDTARDKQHSEVTSKRRKRTMVTGGKQQSSNSMTSSSASSYDHTSSVASDELQKQEADPIFSVTVKYRHDAAHEIGAFSTAHLGQGQGQTKSTPKAEASNIERMKMKKSTNRKPARVADAANSSHAFRNSGVSIPRPERGRHVTQPLGNVAVHAIGYFEDRASDVVDNSDVDDANSADENTIESTNNNNSNNGEDKGLASSRISQDHHHHYHHQHIPTRPPKRTVKFAPVRYSHGMDSKINDVGNSADTTFMTSAPYDPMPVRIVSYVPPDESRINKSTNCEAIIRLPPIGNQQGMTSLSQPTNRDQAPVDESPLPSHRNNNSVRQQQKNSNGEKWRQATRNVKEVSLVSTMLTSTRLAPKVWSVSPRFHADSKREHASFSVDERTIVHYPFNVGAGKGNNLDDPNLTIVSLPLLSLYGLYSPFTGAGQFDWPVPPARASTFVDDASGLATIDPQESDQHIAADEQSASAKRIILNVPQVAQVGEE